jgi:hypothetical protein
MALVRSAPASELSSDRVDAPASTSMYSRMWPGSFSASRMITAAHDAVASPSSAHAGRTFILFPSLAAASLTPALSR